MKNITILFVLFILFHVSCEENFEEINTNENVPIQGNPGNLLPSIIFNGANEQYLFANNVLDPLMQYRVSTEGDTQFDFRNATELWDAIYAILGNINEVERQYENDPSLISYYLAAKIMRAYYAGILTEVFIDIPLSEAGDGLDGVISPSYDSQESVFQFILEELEEVNELINDGLTFQQGGDLIYDGDISKWQKFGNSLRLRYLLRISNVVSVSEEMNSIIANPDRYPVFQSNDDDAILDYTGDIPFISPVDNLQPSFFEILTTTDSYVDLLSPSNDPRLGFLYDFPENPSVTEHRGVSAGLTNSEVQELFPASDVSLLSNRFSDVKGQLDFAFMTYSELNFILAEAALKGLIEGDAESFYNEAVLSNISYWGLDAPTDFLGAENVAWDNTLETLIFQKWAAAHFLFQYEAWSDYKRTGLPNFNFPVTTFPATSGLMPTRMIYPPQEQTTNAINYESAVQNIGGDNSLARHWYQ